MYRSPRGLWLTLVAASFLSATACGSPEETVSDTGASEETATDTDPPEVEVSEPVTGLTDSVDETTPSTEASETAPTELGTERASEEESVSGPLKFAVLQAELIDDTLANELLTDQYSPLEDGYSWLLIRLMRQNISEGPTTRDAVVTFSDAAGGMSTAGYVVGNEPSYGYIGPLLRGSRDTLTLVYSVATANIGSGDFGTLTYVDILDRFTDQTDFEATIAVGQDVEEPLSRMPYPDVISPGTSFTLESMSMQGEIPITYEGARVIDDVTLALDFSVVNGAPDQQDVYQELGLAEQSRLALDLVSGDGAAVSDPDDLTQEISLAPGASAQVTWTVTAKAAPLGETPQLEGAIVHLDLYTIFGGGLMGGEPTNYDSGTYYSFSTGSPAQ